MSDYPTDTRQRRITIIPATQTISMQSVMRQKKVAAYCRVSTEEEEQQSSYEAQCSYYTEKILANQEWTMAGIFADEGITGTSAKKRPEFLRMIRMCKQGKIDLILTKSISRFARNTVDCLSYIRLLRGMGIGIFFEKENINTLDADTEIIITFMGAFAQSESESISKNVSWGKRQAMREGKACIHYKRLYGYRMGEDNQPEIIPEQGEIVFEIGQRYLLGDSLRMICDWLNRREIPYLEGKEWTITNIRSILTNEKYRGDVLMQKTFVQDCISKKVVKNTGQLPQYLIENNHPAIFSREMGRAIDAEMARRNAIQSPSVKNQQTGQSHYSAKYALSERLVCGECGTLYRRCTWTSRGQKRIVWRCVNRLDHGTKYCKTSPTIPEEPLQEAILKALNTAMSGKDLLSNLIMDALETEMCILPDSELSLNGIQRRMEELESEFQELLGKAAEEGAESLTQQFRTITEEIASLKVQREQMVQQLRENGLGTQKLEKARMVLTGATADFTTWQEDTIRRFVHTVKVLSADHIKIYLNNGAEIDQEVHT